MRLHSQQQYLYGQETWLGCATYSLASAFYEQRYPCQPNGASSEVLQQRRRRYFEWRSFFSKIQKFWSLLEKRKDVEHVRHIKLHAKEWNGTLWAWWPLLDGNFAKRKQFIYERNWQIFQWKKYIRFPQLQAFLCDLEPPKVQLIDSRGANEEDSNLDSFLIGAH